MHCTNRNRCAVIQILNQVTKDQQEAIKRLQQLISVLATRAEQIDINGDNLMRLREIIENETLKN